jgi:hypothetical protein
MEVSMPGVGWTAAEWEGGEALAGFLPLGATARTNWLMRARLTSGDVVGMARRWWTMLDGGFVLVGELHFLRNWRVPAPGELDNPRMWEHWLDATGCECWFNQLHVLDFVGGKTAELTPDAALASGLAFARALAERLDDTWPKYRFRVILSAYDRFVREDSLGKFGLDEQVRHAFSILDEGDAIESIPMDPDIGIRFHRIRMGESFLDDDLEAFRLQGIMVIDTRSA